jgi:mono/diheme cytochrome c family protein
MPGLTTYTGIDQDPVPERLRGAAAPFAPNSFGGGRQRHRAIAFALACALGLAVLTGCAGNMRDQPREDPLQQDPFFADNQAARPLPTGVVARGQLNADTLRYTGVVNGTPAATFPYPVTKEMLERGQERYNIYCAVCHGATGYGDGIIVQRGFPQPPSYHTDELRNAPPGLFFDVITNGYGVMYSYASRITPDDRWAIVAYIRALQLSQHASPNDVPPAERQKLEGGG